MNLGFFLFHYSSQFLKQGHSLSWEISNSKRELTSMSQGSSHLLFPSAAVFSAMLSADDVHGFLSDDAGPNPGLHTFIATTYLTGPYRPISIKKSKIT